MCDACSSKDCAMAAEVARSTVREVFAVLGIDAANPEDIRHFQANMAYLWRLRKLSEKIGMTIILTAAALITGGVITVLWEALKTKG
jgi:hypothetical protein